MSDYTGPMETGAEESARMSELELSPLEKLQSRFPGYDVDSYARWLEQEYLTLEADNAQLREAHSELIMEVATKYPGESRHETAKRYIQEAESRAGGDGQAAQDNLSKLATQQKPNEEAMLEVIRGAQKMGGAHTRETIQAAWDQHLAPALAALPEHLR